MSLPHLQKKSLLRLENQQLIFTLCQLTSYYFYIYLLVTTYYSVTIFFPYYVIVQVIFNVN